MTTATQAVTDFTLEQLQALYENNFPSKLPAYEEVKATLLDPTRDGATCTQKLQDLLHVPVTVSINGKGAVYNWTGQRGAYRLTVPQATAPAPQETTKEALQAPQKPQEPAKASSEDKEAPEPTKAPQRAVEGKGIFTALAGLLLDTTLLMTISKSGEERGEAVLVVNVVPKAAEGKDAALVSPVCLEGAASDLDEHFLDAITTKAEGNKSILRAIEELKAADEALAEAKKKEAAKKKDAAAKSKSAKEEKAEETQQKPQQEALF